MPKPVLSPKLKKDILKYAKDQEALNELGTRIMNELEKICLSKGYELDILMANQTTKDGRCTEALSEILYGSGDHKENLKEIEDLLNSI